MYHRHTTPDSEAKAEARRALQQAYDWRDESELESRDMDDLRRGFETGVRYPACPTTKSAAAAVTVS